ncbi:hypothetical protein GCM10009530_61980 [Microbispora corallina]|uniref:Uncharacterized protein n=1 Tax=Microbispora corallina TaxID=83302 RepID=A0ABQ4G8T0_9ACTN|nr:hypothetical protein [Microbispora corallina]GIH43383.1 hypothetical protein Mco01_63830 [Microbispora corallina]
MTSPPSRPDVEQTLPSPLDSIPDLRAAAKWILASAGAVGAALLGGGPLVAIGKVPDAGHAALAGLGLLVALCGVGWAIWRTSDVLIPPITTLATLDEPELRPLRELIARSPEAFYGSVARDVAGLTRHRQIAAGLRAKLAEEGDPARRRAWESALERTRANIAITDAYQRRLLDFIHVWQIHAKLRRARAHTLLAGVVVAVGATVFMLATAEPAHPGGPATPAATPSVSTAAT